MGKINILSSLIITALFAFGCGNTSSENDPVSEVRAERGEVKEVEDLKVMTTIPPLYSLTANLVEGSSVELENLLPSGVSVHNFQLTPELVKGLNEADLIVMNGLDLELFLEDMTEELQGEVLVASEGVSLIRFDEEHSHEEGEHEEEKHGDHGHEEGEHEEEEDGDHGHEEGEHEEGEHEEEEDGDHGHEEDEHEEGSNLEEGEKIMRNGNYDKEDANHSHGEYDPHVWLSIENAKILSENILGGLKELSPEEADVFEDNYADLIERLDDLDEEIENGLLDLEMKNYVVFHDAYSYFEQEYDIQPVGYLQEFAGDEPSAEYLAGLIEKIEELEVEVIFVEPQFSPKLVSTLAVDYDLEVKELDPLGQRIDKDIYFDLMRANFEAFSSLVE